MLAGPSPPQVAGMSLAANQSIACCDFDVDPDDPDDDTHFARTCVGCGKKWWGLHCPHDGIQNPCPGCGTRPTPLPDGVPEAL